MDQIVYIHGVVPPGTRDHTDDYAALHKGLTAELVRRGQPALPDFDDSVTVEWGYAHPKAGDTAVLAKAQQVIAERVDAVTPTDRTSFGSLLFAPAIEPVRDLLQHAWADLVYYVSEKGKARVRDVVWGRLLDAADPDAPLDLTVIGHSAGSLIAVDFLFWLFSGERDEAAFRAMGIDPAKVAAAREHWRVRRLVTLGSPIAPLAIRSVAVTDLLAAGKRMDLRDLGFGRPAHAGADPVWLNVWDRHDVLAYPVAPFYGHGRVVDLYPDHSDSLLGAHMAYWRARSVHRVLADRWDDRG